MFALARKVSEASTPDSINQRIRRRTAASIARALVDRPRSIDARLRELDREWDVERALALTASSFVLLGTALSAARGRPWLWLPAIVSGFLLQHSIQGFCPPLPVLRALGMRTRREIEGERTALKAARGDFHALHSENAAGPNTLLTLAEI